MEVAKKLINAGGKHIGEALQKIENEVTFDVINSDIGAT